MLDNILCRFIFVGSWECLGHNYNFTVRVCMRKYIKTTVNYINTCIVNVVACVCLYFHFWNVCIDFKSDII